MPLRDADIRPSLARFAALATPRATVLHEVGLLRGASRVDVAALSPSCLHGYEIKGDTDSLKRLRSQVEAYSRVLDRCTLAAGDAHVAQATALVPAWWGVLRAVPTGAGVSFEVVREGQRNDFGQGPSAMVRLLWCSELEALLEEVGALAGVRGRSHLKLCNRAREALPAEELRARVRQIVAARGDWRRGR